MCTFTTSVCCTASIHPGQLPSGPPTDRPTFIGSITRCSAGATAAAAQHGRQAAPLVRCAGERQRRSCPFTSAAGSCAGASAPRQQHRHAEHAGPACQPHRGGCHVHHDRQPTGERQRQLVSVTATFHLLLVPQYPFSAGAVMLLTCFSSKPARYCPSILPMRTAARTQAGLGEVGL